MSNAAGTVQIILLQIASVFEPLQRELAPDRARATFAELGISITPAQTSALSVPLQTTAGKVRDLLQLSTELTAAIEAENVGDIIAKSVGIIASISGTISGIENIKTAVGGLGSVPPATVGKIPERLFNLLLVNALDSAVGINELLELFNILQREHHNQDSVDPNNPPFSISTFDFGMIGEWLTSPANQLRSIYKWGDPAFDGTKLLNRLEDLLLKLGVPAFFDEAAVPPKLNIAIVQIKPKTDINPKGLSIAISQSLNPGSIVIVTGDLKFEIDLDFRLPFDTELIIQPDGKFTFIPPALSDPISGGLALRVTADRTAAAQGYLIIGDPSGSRLEVRKFTAEAGGQFRPNTGKSEAEFNIGGTVSGGKLMISMENADGFIGKILGGIRLESNFDFGFAISSAEGLTFVGSSTLEIQLPLHVNLGPVELSALTFSVGIQDKKFPTTIATNLKASLGPLVAVVEDIGLKIDFAFKDNRDGNAGPLDVALGFKPPSGVGLSLDAGVIKGGGYLFFDSDKEEYAGALELVFSGFINLKAIGLITTKMPDGSKGFSLLIIITAEFGTGIQLGFGFTLLGVGGLIGLNRTMRLQPLMEGVRTGAINSIMFPQDVIANAPRIISDLRTIFPPEEGKFLIGPMAKIGWGTPTLVSLSLGIIIEIPGNIAIVGVLKVALPTDELAILILQVNFAGAIEFDKKRVYFFAALFESRILFMTLEGEMGLLAAFGDDANFVLSVGGFHPRFNPPPLPFSAPHRISVNLANSPVMRIRVEGYFAVTSNTVQFGARAELVYGAEDFGIQGHLAFDAVFQFSPFYFIIEISASVSLKVFGAGLFSIRLRFSLEGPTPMRARGEGSLSILFFEISADFDVTWGETRNTTLPPIAVMPLLKSELDKLDNWKALPPPSSNLLVSLRKFEQAPGTLVLHPMGALQLSQKSVPLDLQIDKIGSRKPSDAKRFTLKLLGGELNKTKDTLESFAPAQFQNLNDAAKLSRPSFEPMHGGLELNVAGRDLASGKVVKRIVRYEEIIIDNNFKRFVRRFSRFADSLFNHLLKGNAVAQSSLSKQSKTQLQPFEEKIKVHPDAYTVAFNSNNKPLSASSSFTSSAMAHDFLRRQMELDPNLSDALHIIPQSEVNRTV